MTEAFYNHLAKTRHQIHQHPEVSEEEHETTVFLKGYLRNLGIEPPSLIRPAHCPDLLKFSIELIPSYHQKQGLRN